MHGLGDGARLVADNTTGMVVAVRTSVATSSVSPSQSCAATPPTGRDWCVVHPRDHLWGPAHLPLNPLHPAAHYASRYDTLHATPHPDTA